MPLAAHQDQPLSPPPEARTVGRASTAATWLAAALALFLLALGPRLVGLAEATTEDEDQWIARTGNFSQALAAGTWRGTYQIGHPGVTTMWLTRLALGPDDAQRFSSQARDRRLVTTVEAFLPALRSARVPFLGLSALLAAACGLLAVRLVGWGPGLLAGLLLALEPYWSAMSPVVGMDALLAGFGGASLLATLLAFRPGSISWCWALLAGLLAGLAVLTKAPGVLLLPVAPLAALLAWWQGPDRRAALRAAAGALGAWALAGLATLLLWPAIWADPLGTLQRVAEYGRELSGEPHGPGNFFLGRPIDDPGPLFYPLALVLRLGPATLLGVAILAVAAPPPRWYGTVGLLVGYGLLFGLALTVSAKKVDRYILPLLPVLGVLGGMGWWLALRWLASWARLPRLLGIGGLLVGLLQVWPLLVAAPHPLAAYNPLVGGIKTAERVLPVGWGEGLDMVGDYLRAQPEAESLVTAIWYPLYVNFQAHAPGRVVNIAFRSPGQVSNQGLLDQADYYVDYIHARQRRFTPAFLLGREPDFVVTIQGVEYARVYRLKQ